MTSPSLRPLAGRLQQKLQHLYALDDLPPVEHFAHPCPPQQREQLLLREEQEEVALAVHLPAQGLDHASPPLSLDVFCQIIEGVSHFIYLAARIRQDLPSTHLELELQAEVDKFALLALDPLLRGEKTMVWKIHRKLYEQASFLHEEGSVEGDRYRLATRLAARFSARLQGRQSTRESTLRRLRAFHRAGQADKIHLALAA